MGEHTDDRERHQLDLEEIFGIRENGDRHWLMSPRHDVECCRRDTPAAFHSPVSRSCAAGIGGS